MAHIGGCNFTLPSELALYGEYGANAVGNYGSLLNATAKSVDTDFVGNITDSIVIAGITRFSETWRRYTRAEAYECGLSWCAKRYSEVKVIGGEIFTPDIRTWPLKSPVAVTLGDDGIRSGRFEVEENTDFDGPDRTFIVNAEERDILAAWLAAQFFTTSEKDAVGRALYMQPHMSQTFTNIATSMTNKIREGAMPRELLELRIAKRPIFT
ncbi:hypothetical protein T440DRAFT_516084 [Plenodomus tracheiphilus IPT5]|uniref:Uncharacterized protein n=1 Tax=Plenodomus tracheiphilus IPT5 TaxID=1408161 RepID=A0A6A7BBT5_9PLEO|nr:hypothetical protein T440DRAFT_516084 [Plenodomus tracheiphilus IPT5]